jgi:hypothetical protein
MKAESTQKQHERRKHEASKAHAGSKHHSSASQTQKQYECLRATFSAPSTSLIFTRTSEYSDLFYVKAYSFFASGDSHPGYSPQVFPLLSRLPNVA